MLNNSKPPIVIDTNILISAMISPKSILHLVLQKAFSQYTCCISHDTLQEFLEVANRPKFLKYFKNPSQKQEFIDFIVSSTKIVAITHQVTDCQDPKDNKFLEIALSCQALYLVTGDKKDLIAMNPYKGIEIITASEFLSR